MQFTRVSFFVFLLLTFSLRTLSGAGITLNPNEYFLGTVEAGTEVEGLFSASGGDSEIHVVSSCSCITVMPNTIPAGTEELVFWVLDTSGYEGPITLEIKVLTGSEWDSYRIQGTVEKPESRFWIWPAACALMVVLFGGIIIRLMKRR